MNSVVQKRFIPIAIWWFPQPFNSHTQQTCL